MQLLRELKVLIRANLGKIILDMVFFQGAGGGSTVNVRVPIWTSSDGATATLNGQNLALPSPGVNTMRTILFVYLHVS